MAFTVTYRGAKSLPEGLLVKVAETSIGLATESGPIVVPKRGVLKSYRAHLATPGSSSQIDPELGRAAAWTTGDLDEVLAEAIDGPAASINAGDINVHYECPGGGFYLRSQPNNAATDASVNTEFLIKDK